MITLEAWLHLNIPDTPSKEDSSVARGAAGIVYGMCRRGLFERKLRMKGLICSWSSSKSGRDVDISTERQFIESNALTRLHKRPNLLYDKLKERNLLVGKL